MNTATKQQLKIIKDIYPVVNFEYRFVKGGVKCTAYLMWANVKDLNANNFKTQSFYSISDTKERALKSVVAHIYRLITSNTPISC
jgi:hypothetical protein